MTEPSELSPLEALVPMSDIIKAEESQGAPVSFHRLESALHTARADLALAGEAGFAAWVDAVAFGLMTDAYQSEPWKRYFGPMGVARTAEGATVYLPEVRDLDRRALDLWQRRLEVSIHPAIRARYSDLLWELGPAFGEKQRNPAHARTAIAAYEAMVLDGLCQDQFDPDDAALRMLTLALSIGDTESRDRAVQLLLDQHQAALSGPNRLNLTVVDRLLWERKLGLSEESFLKIIADLESVLTSSTTVGPGFDPYLAEYVAKHLFRHYSRSQSRADTRRVHSTLASAFERLAGLGNAMAAASHLDKAAAQFAKAGDGESHARVRISRAAAVEKSNAEMSSHSVEIKVTFDEMEEFLDSVVLKDNPVGTLMRLANQFVPTVGALRKQVLATAESSPIQAFIDMTIHEEEHIAAVIGSVDADMEGRIMHTAGQQVAFDSIHLHPALLRSVDIHDFTPYDFAGWAGRWGAFDDLDLVAEGVDAWFVGDWVKALHVLVPQIEAGLRRTLKGLGEPVVKDHPTMAGRQMLLNMAEVLATPAMHAAMGEDLILYFRARYVDPRAKNLRNVVAHGLSRASDASGNMCDILMHSLLVLGCWREIATHRNADETSE